MPGRDQKRWQGWVVSLLAHLLLLALIIFPVFQSDADFRHAEGAGGAGPAGGGGGGSAGGANNDMHERLRFVGLATPAVVPHVAPPAPVVKPRPPVVQPPQPRPVVPPKPTPPADSVPAATAPATSSTTSAVAGLGAGGSGSGQTGVGPGHGGGIGSGEGSGRGSSTGPGTGGGNATIHPPEPTQFFLPPLPQPRNLHGFRLVAWFDVDSLGKSTLLRFNPSPDGDYNKRLRETLMALKFRPAVRLDGFPVRDTVDVQILF
ncbi:MAG TPA: hypothetical protein VNU46_08375 [Gemmatimonadaceae bacterium]|nr:hypothetical protein [Gemmatimonadaceae bacterium]